MTITENKAIARRFTEAHSHGRLSELRRLLSEDFILHISDWPHPLDSGQYLQGAKIAMGAFSELTFTVEDMVAEGDEVAVRVMVRGRHAGVYQGIQPTRRQVEFGGISIQRIVDGKVAEEWQTNDQLGLLRQLGRTGP